MPRVFRIVLEAVARAAGDIAVYDRAMAILLPLLTVVSLIEPGNGTKLLGWTADGEYLVWTTVDTVSSSAKVYSLPRGDDKVEVPDPEKLSPADRAKLVVQEFDMGSQDDETASLAVIHDAWRGTDERFLLKYAALSYEGKTHPQLKKKYGALANAAAFEAWKKTHALTMTAAKAGPHGGAIAVTVKFKDSEDKPDPPVWKGATLRWNVGMGTAVVEVSTTCGKDRDAETIEQSTSAMYQPTWSVTPNWDPAGHRVVFVFEEAKVKTMRGPDGGRIQYLILACGPRVDVLAPAGLENTTGKVAEAVEKAGFSVVSIGAAKAAREATVIYANPAHAEAAARLAASIPGGATVDKLTWKPDADLVVAIGASAK
jgi:hypothetical protein